MSVSINMSVKITISSQTSSRLKAVAEPLVDTYDTVINRALDALDATSVAKIGISSSDAKSFDPDSPPNLIFTTVRSINFCGKKISPNNWNALLLASIQKAMVSLKDAKAVKDMVLINCVGGEKTDHGYKYLPEIDLSVQGQDSNGAWKGISHIAKELKFPLEIVFAWQENPKAPYPGTKGRFAMNLD